MPITLVSNLESDLKMASSSLEVAQRHLLMSFQPITPGHMEYRCERYRPALVSAKSAAALRRFRILGSSRGQIATGLVFSGTTFGSLEIYAKRDPDPGASIKWNCWRSKLEFRVT